MSSYAQKLWLMVLDSADGQRKMQADSGLLRLMHSLDMINLTYSNTAPANPADYAVWATLGTDQQLSVVKIYNPETTAWEVRTQELWKKVRGVTDSGSTGTPASATPGSTIGLAYNKNHALVSCTSSGGGVDVVPLYAVNNRGFSALPLSTTIPNAICELPELTPLEYIVEGTVFKTDAVPTTVKIRLNVGNYYFMAEDIGLEQAVANQEVGFSISFYCTSSYSPSDYVRVLAGAVNSTACKFRKIQLIVKQ